MFPLSAFHPLKGDEGFLDIPLKVLDQNDRLSLQQEIESFLGTIDF